MKIYRVTVKLYEGEDIDLGTYSTRDKAEMARQAEIDEWAMGPNVEEVAVTEEELK